MIHRFRKVTNDVYRGSAPTIKEVILLKNKLGINKIISLDKESGEKISRICKLLGIEQVKIYLNGTRKSLLQLLSLNLKKLLLDNTPTYIHCYAGKDRTGLLVALFQCKYMDKDPEEAIKEAKSLGFGINVNPEVIDLYEKLIRSCKKDDVNNADIVSNQREYIGDSRDSFLDEAHQGSFAPYLSPTRQYPVDSVYNYINDQSYTRENYRDKSITEHISREEDVIPQVGLYNNDAGGRGFGPTENYSGFFYD